MPPANTPGTKAATATTVAMPPKAEDPAPPEQPPIVLKLNADLTVAFEDGPVVLRGDLTRELRSRSKRAQQVFVENKLHLPGGRRKAPVEHGPGNGPHDTPRLGREAPSLVRTQNPNSH